VQLQSWWWAIALPLAVANQTGCAHYLRGIAKLVVVRFLALSLRHPRFLAALTPITETARGFWESTNKPQPRVVGESGEFFHYGDRSQTVIDLSLPTTPERRRCGWPVVHLAARLLVAHSGHLPTNDYDAALALGAIAKGQGS
jgi:hypothetical protein